MLHARIVSSQNLSRLAAATIALAIMALVPARAHADATISRSGRTITITSNAEADMIVADTTVAGRMRVRFRNGSGRLTPGRGCTYVLRTAVVECGFVAKNTFDTLTVKVKLGGGNDTFRGHLMSDRQPRAIVEGGAGNDLIFGTDQFDDLQGGEGNDRIYGLDDTDDLDGGAGVDLLQGGDGNDSVDGGPGQDTIHGDIQGGDEMIPWGADVIIAFDQEADVIECGRGFDAATVDAVDTFPRADCEGLQGGQNTPPIENPGGTLPMAITIGAPRRTSLGALATGSILHFSAGFSAPAFIGGHLEVSAAEARRTGLGTGRVVLANNPGIPLTIIPITVNAQMRTVWTVRPAIERMRARAGFTTLQATIVLTAKDVNGADTEARRTITLYR